MTLFVIRTSPFCSLQTDQNDNCVIRRISLPTGVVTTLAGSVGVTGSADGIGTAASFSFAVAIAIDASGTFALIVSVWSTLSRPHSFDPPTHEMKPSDRSTRSTASFAASPSPLELLLRLLVQQVLLELPMGLVQRQSFRIPQAWPSTLRGRLSLL